MKKSEGGKPLEILCNCPFNKIVLRYATKRWTIVHRWQNRPKFGAMWHFLKKQSIKKSFVGELPFTIPT
jgi:hypothetical protein